METDVASLKLEMDTVAFGQVMSQEISNWEWYAAN
jgi:hypothetical protein